MTTLQELHLALQQLGKPTGLIVDQLREELLPLLTSISATHIQGPIKVLSERIKIKLKNVTWAVNSDDGRTVKTLTSSWSELLKANDAYLELKGHNSALGLSEKGGLPNNLGDELGLSGMGEVDPISSTPPDQA